MYARCLVIVFRFHGITSFHETSFKDEAFNYVLEFYLLMFLPANISSDCDSMHASFALQTLQPVVLEYCIYTASSYVLQSFFSAFILSNSQASPMTPPRLHIFYIFRPFWTVYKFSFHKIFINLASISRFLYPPPLRTYNVDIRILFR